MKAAISIDERVPQESDQRMLQELNEIYASGPEPDEKRVLKGIKATVRRTVKDRW
jgi:hypothetical protein